MSTTPLCKQPPIAQISTGQAGPEVNRDIETLFRALNRVMRCQAKTADALDAQTAGSFGSGDGSVSAGTTTTEASARFNPDFNGTGIFRLSTAVSIILPDNFTGYAFIDATADVNVTLPTPMPGRPITIFNTGASHVITVKNEAGTSLTPTLMAGACMRITASENASNLPAWPSSATVINASGTIVAPVDVVVVDGTKGLVLFDTGTSTFQRITLVSGSVTITNTASATIPS